jgi:hypothetical protein
MKNGGWLETLLLLALVAGAFFVAIRSTKIGNMFAVGWPSAGCAGNPAKCAAQTGPEEEPPRRN